MSAMWPETKQAVRKAIWVCEVLFSLPPDDYGRLLEATGDVQIPPRSEVKEKVITSLGDEVVDEKTLDLLTNDAMLNEMRRLFEEAAVSVGLTSTHGKAVLEFTALLKDLGDE